MKANWKLITPDSPPREPGLRILAWCGEEGVNTLDWDPPSFIAGLTHLPIPEMWVQTSDIGRATSFAPTSLG